MATLITKNSSTASAVPAAGDLVKGELAVNVTDKKVYTKDNSAAVVKLVGSLGNQEANAVAITGGAINGTTIGATTPSTGAFTTASASGGFTGNLTGNVTGNVSGTAANVTGVVAIANGGTGLSSLGTGVQSALGQAVTGSGSFVLSTSPSLTTPNLGTPSAAVLTNATGLPLTTGVTGTLGVANGGTGITAFGTGVATALGQNVTGSGGIVLATSPSLTTPNLGTPSAATLTNATGLPISTGVSGLGTGVATALGVATGSAGAFVVNGGALGTPSSGTLTNATGLPISTGVSGLGTGVATALAVNTGSAGAFVVNGGALGTPSSGTLTNATGLPLSTGVTGTLATTNGGTGLTSFTANGVVYASSSSALTTGSALTFDGTTLTIPQNITNTSASSSIGICGGNSFSPTNGGYLIAYGGSHLVSPGRLSLGTTGTGVMDFQIAGNEGMRLTSTGLGIGTSSPGQKLEVAGNILINTSGNPTMTVKTSGAGNNPGYLLTADTNTWGMYGIFSDANDTVQWQYNGTSRLTLTNDGNLGLGVTPSAWGSAYKALQLTDGAAFVEGGGNTYVGNNWYNNGSSGIYIANGAAAVYGQSNGQHQWFTAPSGTAGNIATFTQAMTLDASGRLGVGTSSPTDTNGFGRALDLNGPDGAAYYARAGGSGTNFTLFGNYGADGYILNRGAGNLYFYNNNAERARITSGGDLLINTTTSSGLVTVARGASGVGIGVSHSGDAGASAAIRASYTASTGTAYQFDCYFNGGRVGYISSTSTATAYNTSSDYRLKDNPQPLTGSGAFIDALQPKTWNWTADGSRGVGFIAHEVQEVSPGSVVGTKDAVDEEGKPIMQAMEYGSAEFIANIIAELQSLRQRVAALEAK